MLELPNNLNFPFNPMQVKSLEEGWEEVGEVRKTKIPHSPCPLPPPPQPLRKILLRTRTDMIVPDLQNFCCIWYYFWWCAHSCIVCITFGSEHTCVFCILLLVANMLLFSATVGSEHTIVYCVSILSCHGPKCQFVVLGA